MKSASAHTHIGINRAALITVALLAISAPVCPFVFHSDFYLFCFRRQFQLTD
jgi:hypothetical protein